MVTTTMARMFMKRPPRHINGTVSRPEPKRIAFGGVATGIMNAQLAAMVAGITSSTGAIPRGTESAASMGTNVAVVAHYLGLTLFELPTRP